jgi:hypothetical protein
MRQLLLAGVLLIAPLGAQAQGTLNSYQTVDIKASADKVWGIVKGFDTLQNWHPAFSSAKIIGGKDGVPGAMRTLTLKDGPSFDEELLAFDNAARKLRYKIVGEAPLPVTDYDSTMQVLATGTNTSTMIWRSSYKAKGAKDDEAMKVIDGAYRAGLDNLKKLAE